jgi:signal transduction histidine kinase
MNGMSAGSSMLLSVNRLFRTFGTVPALTDVNFTLDSGEVMGVVGQRGAGKSTLFHILGGVQTPTKGDIVFDGESVTLHSVLQAQRLGIFAVYQYRQLLDNASVLHNIFLGREIRQPRLLGILPHDRAMVKRARALVRMYELAPDLLQQHVGDLADEQRQVVALARAVCHPHSTRLLLLDNALEALSFGRQQILLKHIAQLATQGVAVIVSSDDLNHIFAVTDTILVLYQGQQIALRRTSETTPREIVELIVGTKRRERVTPIIWAFENYYQAQQKVEELRQAESKLRQSLERKDSLNRQLVERMGKQVDALDRLNVALQEASRRLMTEREAERKALAREMHDQIIQDLLSYNYQLEEIEGEVNGDAQREKLMRIRNRIRQVVGDLRQICSDLRPPTIDNHGLPVAIRSLVSQWSKACGIPVQLEIDPAFGRLPEPIELSVFRIVQEGLQNVRKHATATQVTLVLKRSAKASLIVQLADNGLGMDEPIDLASLAEQKHFGLIGISERVSLLNGVLDVKSPPNGGVELDIEIPSPYPSFLGGDHQSAATDGP